MMNAMGTGSKLKIGLALGSGSARGMSHIGIIKALAELGVEPGIISGTSVGALVGASYVAGRLDVLEEWACSLTKYEEIKFFDINASLNGFVNVDRFHTFLRENVAGDNVLIEDLVKRFAAVATDLDTGREVWLADGSLTQAVWASLSLPGLFPAIKNNERWLVDGGLVNPVPVSVCRAMGADIVIAVNLNGDIVGKHRRVMEEVTRKDKGVTSKLTDLVREYSGALFPVAKTDHQPPGLLDAIAGSFNITQDRITRSRLAGDPPDIILSPKLSHIGLLEIYRAEAAIIEGRKCVERMMPEITYMLENNRSKN
jgi:NTE family protein